MRFRTCIVVPLFALGCGGSESPGEGAVDLALEEVARFGSLDASGSALTSVTALAVTDSALLVLENQPPRVAVFNRSGEWLRDVGRAGDGPGELQYPTSVGVTDGHIWVGDPFGGRLEVFSFEGSPLASYRWSIAADSLGEMSMPTALLAYGSVLAAPRTMIRQSTTNRSYYAATVTGEPLHRLYREVVSPSDIFSRGLPGGAFVVGRHPLPESPLHAAYPDGSGLVVVERPEAEEASQATFRLLVIEPDGRVELEMVVPYVPRSAAEWLDGYIERRGQDMLEEEGTINREMLTLVRDALAPRRFYPPVTALVAGMDGSIWLRREEVAGEPVTWQVLSRSGVPRGSLSARPAVELLLASLEEVWTVERDQLDVPFVVQYRVVRSRR